MDKRLKLKSKWGFTFLEWVMIYNNGVGLNYSFIKPKTKSKGYIKSKRALKELKRYAP